MTTQTEEKAVYNNQEEIKVLRAERV